ncbi:MAG: ATP synthase subunit I [Thermodesulfobacteriota bacterium]
MKRGTDEDPLLKKVRLMNGLVFALLLLASLVWMTPFFTLGVGLGGLIVLVNFHLLYRILKKAFAPDHLARPRSVIIKYYLRLLGTGILLYFLIEKKLADPLGLVVGLSVIVINLTLLGLNEMRKMLFKEAN